MKRYSLPVLVALVAALLAGCGSSSSQSSSNAAPAARPTTTASSPPTSSTAPTSTAHLTAKPSKLGTILAAGPKRLTVYLFEADTGTTSTCMGACANVWPPVLTSGAPNAAGQALAARLATVKRADGTLQVTYRGHPLYYFAKDGDAGDAYGQGSKLFGAGWYVLAPSGKKIDKS